MSLKGLPEIMSEEVKQQQGDPKAQNFVEVESSVPLRDSMLWQLQTALFTQLGLGAWTHKGVPSYMSGNPYTANLYAHLLIGYLRDLLEQKRIDLNEPFYIFDLGAGTGRFSYVFLKQLLEKTKTHPLFKQVKFRFVMTDIVQANLDFCRTHNYLEPFRQEDILDYTYFHHLQAEPLQLQKSEKTLELGSLKNPCLLIANYFFDTLPQDLLRFHEGKLQQGLVTLYAPEQDQPLKNDNPHLLGKIRCRFDYRNVEQEPFFNGEEKSLNSLVEEYRNELIEKPFLVPSGGLRALDYFKRLSPKGLMLIAGDQGYSSVEELNRSHEPKISLHGSVSMAVNYELMGRWFKQQQGSAFIVKQTDTLFQTFAALLGGDDRKHPETCFAFNEIVAPFDPKDYWRLATSMLEAEEEEEFLNLEMILKLLKMGRYDPMNLHAFFKSIRQRLPEASEEEKQELRSILHRSWEMFYPIHPLEGDFVMNLGVLLYEMKFYAEAIGFLQRSLMIAGENSRIYTNMAACHLALFNVDGAHECFEKAKRLQEAE